MFEYVLDDKFIVSIIFKSFHILEIVHIRMCKSEMIYNLVYIWLDWPPWRDVLCCNHNH